MNILITGANRGIGLEICKALLKTDNNHIFALCRQASSELKSLGVHLIEGIDVSHDGVIPTLQKKLDNQPLDLLINNAGYMERNTLESLDFESIDRQMQINAYGPLRVVKACLPLLSEGARIAMITSRMGSIADNSSGGSYGYRMSKTALNMASMSLAEDLKSKGIAVGLIHPGYVKTDMTGHTGHLTPETSAEGILERIHELSLENTGTFWHVNGEVLPW